MSSGRHEVLRRIAVHVEEAPAGGFEWVLSEARDAGQAGQAGDVGDSSDLGDDETAPWRPLKRARKAVQTYRASMADGLLALQSLIDDLDAGPRRPIGAEAAPKAMRAGKHPAREASRTETEKKPATGSAFGFGLMK